MCRQAQALARDEPFRRAECALNKRRRGALSRWHPHLLLPFPPRGSLSSVGSQYCTGTIPGESKAILWKLLVLTIPSRLHYIFMYNSLVYCNLQMNNGCLQYFTTVTMITLFNIASNTGTAMKLFHNCMFNSRNMHATTWILHNDDIVSCHEFTGLCASFSGSEFGGPSAGLLAAGVLFCNWADELAQSFNSRGLFQKIFKWLYLSVEGTGGSF